MSRCVGSCSLSRRNPQMESFFKIRVAKFQNIGNKPKKITQLWVKFDTWTTSFDLYYVNLKYHFFKKI